MLPNGQLLFIVFGFHTSARDSREGTGVINLRRTGCTLPPAAAVLLRSVSLLCARDINSRRKDEKGVTLYRCPRLGRSAVPPNI